MRWLIVASIFFAGCSLLYPADLPPSDADFTGVWGSSPQNVFLVAGGRSGKILHRCGSDW